MLNVHIWIHDLFPFFQIRDSINFFNVVRGLMQRLADDTEHDTGAICWRKSHLPPQTAAIESNVASWGQQITYLPRFLQY